MSYERVIPRDLFNEASLLKCYGHLYILLEGNPVAGFSAESVPEFDIVQSAEDGSLFIDNLPLLVGGEEYRLRRPLNSRSPWPLYAGSVNDPDFEEIQVFTDNGTLTTEMQTLIRSADTRIAARAL